MPIKTTGDRHSLILAGVIHDNDKIDNAVHHHLFVSLAQGACCIVGRHDDDNFAII